VLDSYASPNDSGEMPPMFVCAWSDSGLDAGWVRVAGELDIATVSQLERTLHERQSLPKLVVLDLRELAFIDSSGLHAIVRASVRARQAGRRLAVLRGPPHVDRLFTLTGVSDELEIRDLDPTAPRAEALLRLAEDRQAAKRPGAAV
jgi:anti-sigma B factor antagonist